MGKHILFRRLHLFEFNDSPFCPAFLRNSVVEILGRTIKSAGFYDPVLPIFNQFCDTSKCTEILDLCSGSGVPIASLLESLQKKGKTDIRFHLSDLYPLEYNQAFAAQNPPHSTSYTKTPIDAVNIGESPEHQARTLIAAFHHFRPEQARKILEDTVKSNKAIFILEPFPRQIKTTLPFIIKSFIPGMLNPLHSREDKILKMLFTTIIPIIPLIGWWDTIVSALRMYNREEYLELVKDFNHYQWNYQELPISMGGVVTVFTGIPIDQK
ncbi:MAG TPA: hypothetical protein ENI05_14320 [Porticoccus sp.]|nr:hypothetical protein [Porticoccus sp.]